MMRIHSVRSNNIHGSIDLVYPENFVLVSLIILAVESYTTIIISMPHFSFLKGLRLFILQNTPHSIFLLASRKPSTMHTSAIEKEGHKSGSKNSLSHVRCVFIHVEGGGLYCHRPRAAHRGFLAAPPSAAGLVTWGWWAWSTQGRRWRLSRHAPPSPFVWTSGLVEAATSAPSLFCKSSVLSCLKDWVWKVLMEEGVATCWRTKNKWDARNITG